MKTNINTYIFATVLCIVLLATACQQPGQNNPGSEYMPDMAHSVAYEANYYNYYYNNTWGTEDEYYAMNMPRKPVPGTVPYTAPGTMAGSVAYHYGDTEEERTRATNSIIDNPLKITDAGLAEGKELYNVFCAICHGDKGDGLGYIAREDGGKYPVQPANFLLDDFVSSSNGRYYHSIMYGKNLMGAYKDKLAYSERWNVIHYIRSLQAKEKKLAYNQYENTLNSVDVPAGDIPVVAEIMHDDDTHGHDDHGHDEHDHEGDGHGHDGHEHHGEGHEGHEHEGGEHDHDHKEEH